MQNKLTNHSLDLDQLQQMIKWFSCGDLPINFCFYENSYFQHFDRLWFKVLLSICKDGNHDFAQVLCK